MAVACKKCNRIIRANQKYVNCSNCNDVYHLNCGQVADIVVKQIEQGISDWRCVGCRTSKNRKSIVSIASDVGISKSSSTTSMNQHSISALDMSSLASNHDVLTLTPNQSDPNNLAATLETLALNIKSLSVNQQATMVSLSQISEQMATLQTLHYSVDKHDQQIKALEAENISMKTLIKNLASKVDNFEQKSNNNKLQINLVPYSPNEDLHRIVIDVADKLNVSLDKNDILDVFRTKSNKVFKPKINNTAGNTNNEDSESCSNTTENITDGAGSADAERNDRRPITDPNVNSIVVNFKSRATTMAILQGYRNTKNHELFFDINNKHRIFVNEFLISNRRRLFYKAKLFCKVNNYKYLWTRNGNIFIRKQDGGKKIRINHNIDFASIEDHLVGEAASV